MAIAYKPKNSVPSTDILKAFNISKDLITAAMGNSISVSIAPSKLLFYGQGNVILGDVKLAAGAADMALKGELGKFSLEHLNKLITDKLEALIKNPHWKVAESKDAAKGEVDYDEVAPPVDIVKEPEAPVAVPDGKVVPLEQATVMYQQVYGTSQNSRYLVVGLSQDLKLAARYKGNTLSIRAEGNISGHSSDLVANDFTLSSDKHASVHIEVPTLLLAQRVIGALLSGLGVVWQTAIPSMKLIHNKGV